MKSFPSVIRVPVPRSWDTRGAAAAGIVVVVAAAASLGGAPIVGVGDALELAALAALAPSSSSSLYL